jgi:hypothetical protein
MLCMNCLMYCYIPSDSCLLAIFSMAFKMNATILIFQPVLSRFPISPPYYLAQFQYVQVNSTPAPSHGDSDQCSRCQHGDRV